MYIGIDAGTSEIKTLLLDEQHRVLASSGVALDISRPHPGHSEQDPHAWWDATCQAIAQLRHSAPPKAWQQVRGIGLSGQMHGAVLLDQADRVLRPAILWNDVRSAEQCQHMMQRLPQLGMLGGSLAMPGFTAPKLLWVAQHEPEVFAQVAKVLLPKDYVRLQLTGDYASDMSDASGTLWLDVARRDWSDELLALTGLNRSHMPRLVEGSQSSGTLRPALAAQWGLPANVQVAGGGGDNAASAIGMGMAAAGQGFLSLGTSGVMFVVTPGYQPNPASATHAFCHALPGLWHQMSVMLSAASALQWVTQLLGYQRVADLEPRAAALSSSARSASPLFLPYLAGERTPHNDALVRGSFHHLTLDTDPAQLTYSVMEGVGFGLRDGLAALQAAGTQVASLSLVGGGARSRFWAQLLANTLGVPIVTHEDSALGGALGAARLAWLACGAPLAQVCTTPPVQDTFTPQATEHDALQARYQRFKRLYQPGSEPGH
ncbi:xylulokinase [Curvibacter sp. CHRR-16]|uniref:xylulokinase n=1 Tax=Curvibacter sp. CHRR-16 TaxID=2835872 RepID=UPI001BDA0A24|nr:xylulokinase [Curvibacter sp. CHRR-16]MBT0569485.1 xylulokinase [Curvibacter sp. CHRR-16]